MRIHQASFTDEKVRIEVGERCAEFLDFLRRAVDFEPDDIGEFEKFSEQFADVSEMSENAFGTDVGFAAKGGVAVAGEIVIQAGRLGGGFFNERWHERGKGFEVTFTDFEIRMEADGVG